MTRRGAEGKQEGELRGGRVAILYEQASHKLSRLFKKLEKGTSACVEQLASKKQAENFFNYCRTLTRRGLARRISERSYVVRACVRRIEEKWILRRNN